MHDRTRVEIAREAFHCGEKKRDDRQEHGVDVDDPAERARRPDHRSRAGHEIGERAVQGGALVAGTTRERHCLGVLAEPRERDVTARLGLVLLGHPAGRRAADPEGRGRGEGALE